MNEQRNLLLAILVSVAILFGFQFAFGPQKKLPDGDSEFAEAGNPPVPIQDRTQTPSRHQAELSVPVGSEAAREVVLGQGARIPINPNDDGATITGSIALTGGRIDDVILNLYQENTQPDSPRIVIFSPPETSQPYHADFGWVADQDTEVELPGHETVWASNRHELNPSQPVQLSWQNDDGLRFEREIAVDENYMFTITDRVINDGDRSWVLYPYGLISRTDEPKTLGFFILHEGPLGVFNGTLQELSYDDLRDKSGDTVQSTGGWIGITDKYWLAALIPDQTIPMTGRFSHRSTAGREKFQVDYLLEGKSLAPAGRIEVTNRLFAGAKVVTLLDQYEKDLGIARFDLAVDFGWFYFLTKPLFYLIRYLTGYLGNIGLAILSVTVIIKLIFFPLANKSYVAMSKLKRLQPEMLKLREQFSGDKVRLNQEMMTLYKREGANPLAGCLPIVIQIPVFFALYKVLFVTIEMRHAPFYGWIQDLSAPDPTNLFNVFGILPYTPPEFLAVGIWPIAMGFTMWLQQKLNPAPPDPMQAKIMMMLPIVFTFLFARFAVGLVIYWTWNNVLSILQQWVIMRRMGVKA
ncbi:MAG: Membrane protein insertase YidC [Alphaproteobacteria bacterium MarineAlpha9_Bin7]|nr:MAG: Membrane protein insertase YidC [Alphaproteobacteria bacterium MarineAlpha9_Bin7]